MLNNLLNTNTDSLISLALDEDLDDAGDLTSRSVISPEKKGYVKLISRSAGILSGIPIFLRVYEIIDKKIKLNFFASDGDKIENDQVIAELRGNMHSILKGERTSLNFLQRLSGISTLTHHYVDKISHTNTKILDTRKTTPGFRYLEKYAVKQGGGVNHRLGLFDMILIKENHIASVGRIEKAVERCLNWIKDQDVNVQVEVEVQNCEQIQKILDFPINRVMLDNFSMSSIKDAVNIIDNKFEVEVSGNITLETVQEIAETGVDFISVGSLTHSARSLDMSMLL